MASRPKKTPAVVAPAPFDPDAMTKVTLKHTVEIGDIRYKPGVDHVVNTEVLVALGDAVMTSEPA